MSGYRKTFEVIWSDVDPNGHARHTSYSNYAAALRFSFMFEHGISSQRLKELGVGPVILTEELKFLRELMLSETFEIDYKALGMAADGSNWKLRHDVVNAKGKRSARITLDGGWLDMTTRKLVAPADELLQVFLQIPKDKNFRELPSRMRP